MEIQIRIVRRLNNQQLIETDAQMPIRRGESAPVRKNILRYRVNDHKIVAKAMHFRELHHLLQSRGTERYR